MLRSTKQRIFSHPLYLIRSHISKKARSPYRVSRYWNSPHHASPANKKVSTERFHVNNANVVENDRRIALVLASDVEHVKFVLDEVELLEDLLEKEKMRNDGKATNKSVALRGSIHHLVTQQNFLESLKRLESEKERSLLGLSSEEHDLLVLARKMVNSSNA